MDQCFVSKGAISDRLSAATVSLNSDTVRGLGIRLGLDLYLEGRSRLASVAQGWAAASRLEGSFVLNTLESRKLRRSLWGAEGSQPRQQIV